MDSSLGNSWIPCILLGEGSSRDGMMSVGAMLDTVGEEVGVDIGVESEVVEWAVRFLKDIVYMLLPFLLLGCRGLLEVGAVGCTGHCFAARCPILLRCIRRYSVNHRLHRRCRVRCGLLAVRIGFRLIVFRLLLSVLLFVLFLLLLLAGAVD